MALVIVFKTKTARPLGKGAGRAILIISYSSRVEEISGFLLLFSAKLQREP